MGRVTVFCFPYAGGSAAVYNRWKAYLSPELVLEPVELAGRGRRMNEDLYGSIDEAVEDVFQQTAGMLNRGPYVLFGHSMGAAIVFGLVHKLQAMGHRMPLHVFFSGRGAPHIRKSNEKKYHLMGDALFREEIIQLGGTPAEFFEYPQLLSMYMPVLRNDFRIVETEELVNTILPLNVSISVFLGKDDHLTSEQCTGWKDHTQKDCVLYYFNGGHFFLQEQTAEVVARVNSITLCYFRP